MCSSSAVGEANVVSNRSTPKPRALRCELMYSSPSGGYGFITAASCGSSNSEYPWVSRTSVVKAQAPPAGACGAPRAVAVRAAPPPGVAAAGPPRSRQWTPVAAGGVGAACSVVAALDADHPTPCGRETRGAAHGGACDRTPC